MSHMENPPKALPRARRDKSPSASASSFSSIKSMASEKLKKMPLISRRKKKKKNLNLLHVPDNHVGLSRVESKSDMSDFDMRSSQETLPSPSADYSYSPHPFVSRKESNDSLDSGKSAKSSKTRFKKLFKEGKNLFRGKGESVPIKVEGVRDVRRSNNKKDDDHSDIGSFEEVNENGKDIEPIEEAKEATDEETDDYDWSIMSTCARVKKLSIAEIRESVYEDANDEDVIDDADIRSMRSERSMCVTPEIPEDEISIRKFHFVSASVPATPDPSCDLNDQSSLNFNRKSPSTLKKEILQITRQRRASEQYTGALVKNRKVSLQARNLTDKNELLFKILVIGELGTGKTSIIKRYVHQFFSQHYRATIGVDFALKVLSWDDNTTIRLQLWDIAGQERFGNMTRVYYKEAVGAFIVFDVTRVSTFEAVVKWKQDLDSKVQLADGGLIPCVLLANKCDQPKEGIVNSQTKMDEFCKENKFIAWYETSAKDNINIDEAAHTLVTKIVQNDQKRQEEKETINGVTPNSSISLDNNEREKKSCTC